MLVAMTAEAERGKVDLAVAGDDGSVRLYGVTL